MKNLTIIILTLFVIWGCRNSAGDGVVATPANDPVPEEPLGPNEWGFVDKTTEAGFSFVQGWATEASPIENVYNAMTGGVAAGDFDGDGDIDLYVVAGNQGTNLLYQNNNDGTFTDVAAAKGVAISGRNDSGPTFADYDGDGKLDLIVGGMGDGVAGATNATLRIYKNNGSTFTDVSATALPLAGDVDNYSVSLGDYDNDGYLDLFLTHWFRYFGAAVSHGDKFLWKNNGNGTFSDVTTAMGLAGMQFTFAATFSDVNNDGFSDLLIASDFSSAKLKINSSGSSFADGAGTTLTGNNAMGSAVGDYDNDGDLDWFVSHIYWPSQHPNYDGNRLYKNNGSGVFSEVGAVAGIRQGSWGWAACFADFNNDGWLDLFHVNGMLVDFSINDTSVLFVNNKDGTFTEKSVALKLVDAGQGRGISCFDADRDGDIDIFVANNSGAPAFYRNENGNLGKYISIKLTGNTPNTQAIGSRITVVAGGLTQIREIRIGSNYVSQNPAEAHFGLAAATIIDSITVKWYDGPTTNLSNVSINQLLTIVHP